MSQVETERCVYIKLM